MCPINASRSKCVSEMMKFSFHHRAFYCYLGMTIWIFFLITVMYKYMCVSEESVVKAAVHSEHVMSKSDAKFRKIYMQACNPADSILRGSEGLVDADSWVLQGVLVVMRHGDRGPLTHLRGGDQIPCDTEPVSPLFKSYTEWVGNASAGGRPWWVAAPGPFHNFPALPPRGQQAPGASGTHCPLGQLTPQGLLQMITVGNILREAYGELLDMDAPEVQGKKDTGAVVAYSTRYRRTFQSLVGVAWGAWRGAGGARAAHAREAHAVAFCFSDCACKLHHALNKKINLEAKKRLDSHPAIKELVVRFSRALFESHERPDADVVRDALLAHVCHDSPLPCARARDPRRRPRTAGRGPRASGRGLLHADTDALNVELDYVNKLDFDNEVGRKARDIIGDHYDARKQPLDFDAQMEREKLLYYQQRYGDNAEAYDEDVVVVKKNLDADFNFPNDAGPDADLEEEEEEREPTPDAEEELCVRKEHVTSLFAYLEWSHRQEARSPLARRRGLLLAYGLLRNIVQNMIRMISEGKPRAVLYSGHDRTLQALALALGLARRSAARYAARLVLEVFRRRELREEGHFARRKAVAQDFYFRAVYDGEDVTGALACCRSTLAMRVPHPLDDARVYTTRLCPIESIVRFLHDDYFLAFNATNYKDACAADAAHDPRH